MPPYTRTVGPMPVARRTGRGGSAKDAGSDTQTGAALVTTSVGAEAGAIAKGSAGVTVSTGVLDASFLRSHGFPLPTSAPVPASISPTSARVVVDSRLYFHFACDYDVFLDFQS